jgi:hypothetical protein
LFFGLLESFRGKQKKQPAVIELGVRNEHAAGAQVRTELPGNLQNLAIKPDFGAVRRKLWIDVHKRELLRD